MKNLDGEVRSDSMVWHFYLGVDGLIERMDLEGSGPGAEHGASSAFSRAEL